MGNSCLAESRYLVALGSSEFDADARVGIGCEAGVMIFP